ncbi:MAG: acyl-CoA dehydrogenase family protein [Candidatus Nanopelagicales bacterium]|nr:acyl-CoA dehydrogenase [Actinomycetota bacterium]MBT5183520.1 acyl-CoA dehydrogenase [Actinomycetota bacterium]MBT5500610.1 acyl-CoA dehydrogenase [Actinomycetota bacterium]MBT5806170.1 acyl-CoA dehydrogenase [Actinomycetota bacterium]
MSESASLTPEQTALRTVAREVANDVYAPLADEWDATRTLFPDAEIKRLAELGFLGICLPEEYGGSDAPLMDALIVIEELAKVCRPAAFEVFEANVGPVRVLQFYGTAAQCEEIIPKVVAGQTSVGIGISEPDAGSGATDMRTSARLDGDEYVINGTKRWISGGGHAGHYLLYCRLNDSPGSKAIGAILVAADTPGLSFGAPEKLMGFRGIASADLIFEDARVPKENLVISAGGFKKLFGVFSIERMGNATMSLALGQAALEKTIAYTQEREQFGRPIYEFQNVQQSVADMAIDVEAARLLIKRAALTAGNGLPDTYEVSLAKVYSNEMAKRVTDMAMQLHGGNGYTEEYGIERLHRDSHGWAIAGGTPAMQRIRIASEIYGKTINQRSS